MEKHVKFHLVILVWFITRFSFAQTTITNKGTEITNESANIYISGSYVNQSSASIANGGTIYIKKDLINNSKNNLFSTNKGKVVFNGNIEQIISGDSSIHFYQLEVNKSAGNILLNENIQLSSGLKLIKGDIDLNGNTIDLDTSGQLIGESNSRRVYGNSGFVTARKFISGNNTTLTNNIAGLGLFISTKEQFGYVRIERGNEQQSFHGDSSVFRYFNFIPEIPGKAGMIDTVKIAYFDNTETVKGESNYKIYSSLNEGTDWRNKGGVVDTMNNFIISSTVSPPEIGIVRFSVFPSENSATCLPNDPNYISAVFLVASNVLSGDSTHFVQLTSPAPKTYAWNFGDGTTGNIDFSPFHIYVLPDTNKRQYQISMTVHNDACSDTRKKTITVSPKPPARYGGDDLFAGIEWMNLYPNPNVGNFTIEIKTSIINEDLSVSVMNMQGKLIEERKVKPTTSKHSFDLSNYIPGVYYINVQGGEDTKVLKMVKL